MFFAKQVMSMGIFGLVGYFKAEDLMIDKSL